MRSSAWCLIIAFFCFFSCQKDEQVDEIVDLDILLTEAMSKVSRTGNLNHYIFPDSDDYTNLPNQDPANPITREKVKLGKLLFFETGLAQIPKHQDCYETYSCGSCHIPSAGFLPGRIQGIADGGQGFGISGENRDMLPSYEETELDAQGTRPMNPMNSGYSTNTLWSGAFGAAGVNVGTEEYWTGLTEVNHLGFVGLEAQNVEAFTLHRLEINDHVLDDYGYRALYDDAFPDFPTEERYSPITSSFAISAFLRSFLANYSPMQAWLRGKHYALTDNQKEGALLFFGKARCYTCHNGPAFNSMNFHALGTPDMYTVGGLNTGPDDPRNLGRGMFTGQEEDMHRFKVPQLYNLKDYATFFHGSSKQTIREVVEYKIKAQSENPHVSNDRLSPSFVPLDLSEDEINKLIDFLENALYDAHLDRYIPHSVLSGNCFPNNDQQSREELGCN